MTFPRTFGRASNLRCQKPWLTIDRKSTRLNSSHSQISYAVFCLKKKKPPEDARPRRIPVPQPQLHDCPTAYRRPTVLTHTKLGQQSHHGSSLHTRKTSLAPDTT